jgi:hypothetical protein
VKRFTQVVWGRIVREDRLRAQGRRLGRLLEAVSKAYDGDIQMIDSSSIRVHQHAANAQKKTIDPVAWVVRGAA